MQIKVDTRKFMPAVRNWSQKVQDGAIDVANLTAAGLAEELRRVTPVRTGQTRKAVSYRTTSRIDEPARAGFFPGKGKTAFVANLLEYGTGPRWVVGRIRPVKRRFKKIRYAGRGPVRPILAPAMANAREIADEAIARVFTAEEIRLLRGTGKGD